MKLKHLVPALTIASALLAGALLSGCATAINTQDVTDITVTTTGLKLGQDPINQSYQLTFGRQQTRYLKVPTNRTGTNVDSQPVEAPAVVSSYEVNSHSAIFGNASMTTTLATGSNGVATALGGAHPPINVATGTNNNLQAAPGITGK